MISRVQRWTTASHGIFPMMIRPKYRRRRVQCIGRGVWEGSCADIVHNRWATVELSRPLDARPRRPNRSDQGGEISCQANTAHSIKTQCINVPNCPTIHHWHCEGKCIKEIDRCAVESRVATAGMLMHESPLGRDNRARDRGPHRSQEQIEILKELATLMTAQTTRGRPGRASVAVQQCMTQFGLHSDFKMTSQEFNRVANLLEWTTVLMWWPNLDEQI